MEDRKLNIPPRLPPNYSAKRQTQPTNRKTFVIREQYLVLSSDLKFRDLQVQILDFAGQLEEHVSHRLFAQDSEALFCVVANISGVKSSVKEQTVACRGSQASCSESVWIL